MIPYPSALDNLRKLPNTCFSVLPSTGELIGIRVGQSGYVPLSQPQFVSPRATMQGWADELNAGDGVTKAQERAMLSGSMFGWGTHSANPDNYDPQTGDFTEAFKTALRAREQHFPLDTEHVGR